MYSANLDIVDGELGYSDEEGGKATFGFNFTCDRIPDSKYAWVQGHLTYHDHGSTFETSKGKIKKVAFQAVLPPKRVKAKCAPYFGYDEELELAYFYGYFKGSYTPIPPNAGDGGEFSFFAADSGIQGPDKMDAISIELEGGILDGYTNEGMTGGGNIHLP